MKPIRKIYKTRLTSVPLFSLALIGITLAYSLSPQWAIARDQETAPSIFSVYADNRDNGIPNHITADLALISYSLLRQNSIQIQEEQTIIPQFSAFLNGLEEALDGQKVALASLPEGATARKALKTNVQLVQLLQSLMHPDRAQSLDEPMKAEFTRVMDATDLHDSYLWGRRLDYTQYKPRGRYTRDAESEQFFRAFRYISGQWFAVKPSAATSISVEECQLQTAQLIQLVELIQENESLQAQRQALQKALDWQFGVSEDLRDTDVVKVLQANQNDDDYLALSRALFDHAVEHKRQPSVIDAVVELNLVESDAYLQDVVTGWRLIPSRISVQMATQQALLHDQTGGYVGDDNERPFGYGVVNGQGVKSYPSAQEWLALISDEDSVLKSELLQSPEASFVGYETAFAYSQRQLGKLEGAELLHAQIVQKGIDAFDAGRIAHEQTYLDEQTLHGFQTWQRFLDVLYTRQSYTASAKGLMLVDAKRESASLDAATDLYLMLAHAARVHWRRTAVVEWQAFAKIMDELVDLSAKTAFGGVLSVADIEYLNNMDRSLSHLTGGLDDPIVVDVHTNPNENRVVQQATGYARLVFKDVLGQSRHRGARLSFYEFKQPAASRMTVEQWRTELEKGAL